MNRRHFIAHGLYRRAQNYRQRGDAEAALDCLEQAYELFHRLGDMKKVEACVTMENEILAEKYAVAAHIAQDCLRRAKAHFRAGQLRQALSEYAHAERLYRDLGWHAEGARCHQVRMEIQEQFHRHE